jgi:hypothetical protein
VGIWRETGFIYALVLKGLSTGFELVTNGKIETL